MRESRCPTCGISDDEIGHIREARARRIGPLHPMPVIETPATRLEELRRTVYAILSDFPLLSEPTDIQVDDVSRQVCIALGLTVTEGGAIGRWERTVVPWEPPGGYQRPPTRAGRFLGKRRPR